MERIEASFPNASFSDAVIVPAGGRWVMVSGQVGLGEDGKVVAGGLEAETATTFDHIERVLAKAGGDLSHVVKLTVFLTDLREYAAFSAIRKQRVGDALPASSAVGVKDLLLGAQVEIDAVAFIPA